MAPKAEITPWSQEAERSLIGWSMISPAMFDRIADLVDMSDFLGPDSRIVWDAIERLRLSGEDTSAKSVAMALETSGELDAVGGRPGLAGFISDAGVYNDSIVATTAGVLIARSKSRKLIDTAADIVTRARLLEDPDALADELAERLIELDRPDASQMPGGLTTVHDFVQGYDPEDAEWIVEGLLRRDWRCIIVAPEGIGKALALDTPIVTARGMATMGEIRPGDVVFDEKYEPCNVVAATEVMFGRPCFKMRFSDGSSIVADAEHEWAIVNIARGDSLTQISTTAEIRESLNRFGPMNHVLVGPVTPMRWIRSVEPVASVPVRCIQVDSPSHLYLAGWTMIPTHNSFVLRGVAGFAAQGIHPFTHRQIDPVRTLVMDFENPDGALYQGFATVDATSRRVSRGYEADRSWLWRRPEGIDLRSRADRRMVERVLQATRPDLVAVGPLYNTFRKGRGEDDQEVVTEVAGYWTELRTRYRFAFLAEHHAPHGSGGANRDLRPFGSSAWLRWPELGFSLRLLDVNDPNVLVRGRWRGDRVIHQWPDQIFRDSNYLFNVWDRGADGGQQPAALPPGGPHDGLF